MMSKFNLSSNCNQFSEGMYFRLDPNDVRVQIKITPFLIKTLSTQLWQSDADLHPHPI